MSVSVLAAILITLFSFAQKVAAPTQEPQEGVTVGQRAVTLEVTIVPDKRVYKRKDDIHLELKVINTHGVKDVFIYGTLEVGHRGSFTLYRRDARGKDFPTRSIPEALSSPPQPNDHSAFVKLLPDHFIGTFFRSSIRDLNMARRGRYTMWVEYHCPISTADVQLSPFWGKENGTVKSNIVEIEVLR